MPVAGNEDHKQRVNLSDLARSVIEIDRSVFDEGGSLSGFLNRIITAFRDTAEASVDLVAEERQQQLLRRPCLVARERSSAVSRLLGDEKSIYT